MRLEEKGRKKTGFDRSGCPVTDQKRCLSLWKHSIHLNPRCIAAIPERRGATMALAINKGQFSFFHPRLFCSNFRVGQTLRINPLGKSDQKSAPSPIRHRPSRTNNHTRGKCCNPKAVSIDPDACSDKPTAESDIKGNWATPCGMKREKGQRCDNERD